MQYAQKLEDLEKRFEELTAQMADPAVISDGDGYRKTAKNRSDIEPIVNKYREYKQVAHNLADARLMLGETDPELRQMALDEVQRLEPEISNIENELKVLLLPKDPN